jgi:hypothetical protein
MKFHHITAAAVLAVSTLSTLAQPVPPASGPGPCAAGAANASPCPPQSQGPHHQRMRRQSAGSGDTPGWSMMSAEERREHQQKMHLINNYDECKAYLDKHREQMVERARKLGRPLAHEPRRDACAPLKSARP